MEGAPTDNMYWVLVPLCVFQLALFSLSYVEWLVVSESIMSPTAWMILTSVHLGVVVAAAFLAVYMVKTGWWKEHLQRACIFSLGVAGLILGGQVQYYKVNDGNDPLLYQGSLFQQAQRQIQWSSTFVFQSALLFANLYEWVKYFSLRPSQPPMYQRAPYDIDE